ncbi:hypothetical protein FB563_1103 [Streptomyces puniciscabiei]|uniref:Uncharacterized protein n=1 Tax=Streptomyces puniciscabiei TaxID=164348 RepID=A0A542UAU8_9ACTN|nr:hypothetical protein FB563_1103 [Streptomyces puniciscabiei]
MCRENRRERDHHGLTVQGTSVTAEPGAVAAPLPIRTAKDRLSGKCRALQSSVKVHRCPALTVPGGNSAAVQFLRESREGASALDHEVSQKPHHLRLARIHFESRAEGALPADHVAEGRRTAWPSAIDRLQLPTGLCTADDSPVVGLHLPCKSVYREPPFETGFTQGLGTALNPRSGILDLPDATPDGRLRSPQTVEAMHEDNIHLPRGDVTKECLQTRTRVRRARLTHVLTSPHQTP